MSRLHHCQPQRMRSLRSVPSESSAGPQPRSGVSSISGSGTSTGATGSCGMDGSGSGRSSGIIGEGHE